MKRTTFDVIVIGAGAAGASTAYTLAKRGQSVLLLEQFGVGHDRGSSFGPSRIFRFAYDHPTYVRMAMRALDLWRALETDAGTQLYWPTGILNLGGQHAPFAAHIPEALRAAHSNFEMLDAGEIMRRFPQWRVPDDWCGLYSEFAGIVNPGLTTEVLVGMARVHGATVLDHTPVRRLDLHDARAPGVVTDAGTFSAAKVVVSAGAWLSKLVPQWRAHFRVQENLTVFFRPLRLEPFQIGRFPLFIQEDGLTYGFPLYGLPGVKVALHGAGPSADPDQRDSLGEDARVQQLRAWLERHLPEAAGPVMQAKTCLYTNTADGDFVFDRHPASSHVIISSPCSGHGFKFTPLLGEIVADLVQDRPNAFHLPMFSFARATLA